MLVSDSTDGRWSYGCRHCDWRLEGKGVASVETFDRMAPVLQEHSGTHWENAVNSAAIGTIVHVRWESTPGCLAAIVTGLSDEGIATTVFPWGQPAYPMAEPVQYHSGCEQAPAMTWHYPH